MSQRAVQNRYGAEGGRTSQGLKAVATPPMEHFTGSYPAGSPVVVQHPVPMVKPVPFVIYCELAKHSTGTPHGLNARVWDVRRSVGATDQALERVVAVQTTDSVVRRVANAATGESRTCGIRDKHMSSPGTLEPEDGSQSPLFRVQIGPDLLRWLPDTPNRCILRSRGFRTTLAVHVHRHLAVLVGLACEG